jgi:signal transduction histidine kinase
LVEDELIIAKTLLHKLSKLGYEAPFHAETGEQAVQMALEWRPDLVLMDIKLRGGVDGVQAAERIRSRIDVPVVYLTGYADDATIGRAKVTEPFGYIIKPVETQALRSTIELALYKHAMDRRLRESEERYRALAAQLQRVREEERLQIAREIHDDLAQTLTALQFELAALPGLVAKAAPSIRQAVESHVQTMMARLSQVVDAGTNLMSRLRPPALDDLGLVAVLEWYCSEFSRTMGIPCELDFPGRDVPLDKDRAVAAFRIIQEALTNVGRHARASRARVSLRLVGNLLELCVSDDGIGIREEDIAHPRSFGIMGMRERATLSGGEFWIEGDPERGTRVTARLPLSSEREESP